MRKKLCSKCEQRDARAGQAWCRACHTEYMRTWRGRPPTKAQLQARVHELEALINTPMTKDFTAAVENEVAHQTQRWGFGHDDNKTPEEWFWLLGWLLGKAAREPDKRLHHIVTSAAALAQWHRREMLHVEQSPSPTSPDIEGCHAARDGECNWVSCPQRRDCPLDLGREEW